MPLVIRWGGEDFTCRDQVPVELMEASYDELKYSRRPPEDLTGVLREVSVAHGLIKAALVPSDADRFTQVAQGLPMERTVQLFNAIAKRIDLESGRIG